MTGSTPVLSEHRDPSPTEVRNPPEMSISGTQSSDDEVEPWDERQRPKRNRSGGVLGLMEDAGAMVTGQCFGTPEDDGLEDGDLPSLSRVPRRKGEPEPIPEDEEAKNLLPSRAKSTTRPLSPPSEAGMMTVEERRLAAIRNRESPEVVQKRQSFFQQLDPPTPSQTNSSLEDEGPDDEIAARNYTEESDLSREAPESMNSPRRSDETFDDESYGHVYQRASNDSADGVTCFDYTLNTLSGMCGFEEKKPQKVSERKWAQPHGDSWIDIDNNGKRIRGRKYGSGPDEGPVEQTAIEVEYVALNPALEKKQRDEEEAEKSTTSKSLEKDETSRKNAYLSAMARKAKQEFEESTAAADRPESPKSGVWPGTLPPEDASTVTGDDKSVEDVYSNFSPMERRKFLKLINGGMSSMDACNQVLSEREDGDKKKKKSFSVKSLFKRGKSEKGKTSAKPDMLSMSTNSADMGKQEASPDRAADSASSSPSPGASPSSVMSDPSSSPLPVKSDATQSPVKTPVSDEVDTSGPHSKQPASVTPESAEPPAVVPPGPSPVQSSNSVSPESTARSTPPDPAGRRSTPPDPAGRTPESSRYQPTREKAKQPSRDASTDAAYRAYERAAASSPLPAAYEDDDDGGVFMSSSSSSDDAEESMDASQDKSSGAIVAGVAATAAVAGTTAAVIGTVDSKSDAESDINPVFEKSGNNYYDGVRKEVPEEDEDDEEEEYESHKEKTTPRASPFAALRPSSRSLRFKSFRDNDKKRLGSPTAQYESMAVEERDERQDLSSPKKRIMGKLPILAGTKARENPGFAALEDKEKESGPALRKTLSDDTDSEGGDGTGAFDVEQVVPAKDYGVRPPVVKARPTAEDEELDKIAKDLLRPSQLKIETDPTDNDAFFDIKTPRDMEATPSQKIQVAGDLSLDNYFVSTSSYASPSVQDGLSVTSGRSGWTAGTGYTGASTVHTQSSRRRHKGAARNRLAKARAAEISSETRKQGWHESIVAAAASTNREWDPQRGWVDYEDPADSMIEAKSSERIRMSLDGVSMRRDLQVVSQNDEDASPSPPLPFPSDWEKERNDMIGVKEPCEVKEESAHLEPGDREESKPTDKLRVSLKGVALHADRGTPTDGVKSSSRDLNEGAEGGAVQSPPVVLPFPKEWKKDQQEMFGAPDESMETTSSSTPPSDRENRFVGTSSAANTDHSSARDKTSDGIDAMDRDIDGNSGSYGGVGASALDSPESDSSPDASFRTDDTEPGPAAQSTERNADHEDPMDDAKHGSRAIAPAVALAARGRAQPDTERESLDNFMQKSETARENKFDGSSGDSSQAVASDDGVALENESSRAPASASTDASASETDHGTDSNNASVESASVSARSSRYVQLGDNGSVRSAYAQRSKNEQASPAGDHSFLKKKGFSLEKVGEDDSSSVHDKVFSPSDYRNAPQVNVVKEKCDSDDWNLFSGAEEAPLFGDDREANTDSPHSPSRLDTSGPVDLDHLDDTIDEMTDSDESVNEIALPVAAAPVSVKPSTPVPKLQRSNRDTAPVHSQRKKTLSPELKDAPVQQQESKVVKEKDPVRDERSDTGEASTVATASSVKKLAQQWELASSQGKGLDPSPLAAHISESQTKSPVDWPSESDTPNDPDVPAEWKSFFGKKVKAESAAALQAENRRRNTADEERGTKYVAAYDDDQYQDSTRARRSRSYKSRERMKELDQNSPTSPDVERSFPELSPIRKQGDDHDLVMEEVESNTGAVDKNSTFLQRLSTCAAPMLPRQLSQSCNPGEALPSSHLAFLRSSPAVAKVSVNEESEGESAPRRHPDVIVEDDDVSDLPLSPDKLERWESPRKSQSRRRRGSPKSSPQSIGSEVRSSSSVASEDFGQKTAYLEAIAMRAAVSNPKRSGSSGRRRSSGASDVSNSSSKAEAWKAFLERKKARSGDTTNSNTEVSRAAEKYAAEKVEEMMSALATRSRSAPRESMPDSVERRRDDNFEGTSDFSTPSSEMRAIRDGDDRPLSTGRAPRKSESAKAAEELAAARVEAMMAAMSSNTLDEGEI